MVDQYREWLKTSIFEYERLLNYKHKELGALTVEELERDNERLGKLVEQAELPSLYPSK